MKQDFEKVLPFGPNIESKLMPPSAYAATRNNTYYDMNKGLTHTRPNERFGGGPQLESFDRVEK